MRKVKIVCTIGPATQTKERIHELIQNGMDAARLNFSHGDHETHRAMFQAVREAASEARRPLAIIADLGGPKIRIGKVRDGAVRLLTSAKVALCYGDFLGDAERLPHAYEGLTKDVKQGEPILIDDGLIRLQVDEFIGDNVVCTVIVGGVVSDKKGMNLPGTKLSIPAVTEKDKQDIAFAKKLGVDYFALSFVRAAADIELAKSLAGEIPVIAKIEKPEAVDNLDEILNAADGAMVARGDLGVELGHEKVPLVQKRIIQAMRPKAKPVITATQMLDSMIKNPTPTRAEVSDVANAVLDGTDAVMLSGETSVGAYPNEAVSIMNSIICEIEESGVRLACIDNPIMADRSFSSAIANAVTSAATEYDLAAIAVYSKSGRSARFVSAERPKASLIAFSWEEKSLHRMSILWGVLPIRSELAHDVESFVTRAEQTLLAHGLVTEGDDIAITFGLQFGDEPFQTNILKLWKIR